MSTKSQPVRDKWAGLIAEQAGSGLSVPRFCTGQSIAAESMFGWRRKLVFEACGAGEIRDEGQGGDCGLKQR